VPKGFRCLTGGWVNGRKKRGSLLSLLNYANCYGPTYRYLKGRKLRRNFSGCIWQEKKLTTTVRNTTEGKPGVSTIKTAEPLERLRKKGIRRAEAEHLPCSGFIAAGKCAFWGGHEKG